MKRRKIRNRRKDKRMFNQTANKTKKVNLSPRIMRGGIRF